MTNNGASSSLIDVVPPREEQEASGDITFQKSPPAQRCLGEPKPRNRNTKATRFAAVPRLSIVPQDIFLFHPGRNRGISGESTSTTEPPAVSWSLEPLAEQPGSVYLTELAPRLACRFPCRPSRPYISRIEVR